MRHPRSILRAKKAIDSISKVRILPILSISLESNIGFHSTSHSMLHKFTRFQPPFKGKTNFTKTDAFSAKFFDPLNPQTKGKIAI